MTIQKVTEKKATGPYQYFIKKNFSQVQKEYNMKAPEVVTALAKIWRDMTPEEKLPY